MEEEENEEEVYSTELKSDDAELIEIQEILKYHEEWDDWEPKDLYQYL